MIQRERQRRLNAPLLALFVSILTVTGLQLRTADAQIVGPEETLVQIESDEVLTADLAGIGRRVIVLENRTQAGGAPAKLKVYNTDPPGSGYTLEQTISIPYQAQSQNVHLGIHFPSTKLFDSDPGIEYVLSDSSHKVQIIDDSGAVLFSMGTLEAPAFFYMGELGGNNYESVFKGTNGRYRMRIGIVNNDGSVHHHFFVLPGTLPES